MHSFDERITAHLGLGVDSSNSRLVTNHVSLLHNVHVERE